MKELKGYIIAFTQEGSSTVRFITNINSGQSTRSIDDAEFFTNYNKAVKVANFGKEMVSGCGYEFTIFEHYKRGGFIVSHTNGDDVKHHWCGRVMDFNCIHGNRELAVIYNTEQQAKTRAFSMNRRDILGGGWKVEPVA